MSVVEAGVVDDDVGGENEKPVGALGGVPVVHRTHVVDIEQVRADVVQVHVVRGGL